MSRRLPILRMPARERGTTLVELMVSLVVGLLIVLVVSTMFLASKQTNRSQNDAAILQETGRYVFTTLGRELRMAGYNDFTANVSFSSTSPAFSASNDSGLNLSDEIVVRYYGSDLRDGSGPDGGVVDCRGVPVGATTLASNRYYVAVDATTGEPALYCEASSAAGAPVVLVTGVESLQILYGEDTDNDGTPNYYARAGVANLDRVVSAIVSVVVRGETFTDVDGGVARFNHFGTAYAPGGVAPTGDAGAVFDPPDDQRPRRLFRFTIGLRNRIG